MSVISIHITERPGGPVRSLPQVRAVPGRGLEGDRNFAAAGSEKSEAGREVTLIEAVAIDALERDYGIRIAPGEARRNLVTRGVALNHLVGREFRIGEAVLVGRRLCEPCGHLENLTGAKLRAGLIHRGGLRADILQGGLIQVGQPVETEDATSSSGDRPRD
jgi:MOSC domain-containing protein YiiM